MVKRAAEIEDRRIVAKRLFDALCAAYPDKYITLIQPRGVADLPAPDVTAAAPQERVPFQLKAALGPRQT